VTLSGVAAIGFWFSRTPLPERVAAGASAASIMGSFPWSDEIGLAIGAAVLAANWTRARRSAKAQS
jgi:TRAP-type uncharacterized transport system fused permease subunit